MLSYQHAYHAGNFADVHKHLGVHVMMEHLLRKKSSITYIDTHAGRGLYPLSGKEMTRGAEYQDGIVPLLKHATDHPDVASWLAALDTLQASGNSSPSLRFKRYPGSPWWLARNLRSGDQAHFFELHPGEFKHLEAQSFVGSAHCYQRDGLNDVVAMQPVATPRLLCVIDPSYEVKTDYQQVASTLAKLLSKSRHAVVMVWYPVLPDGRHQVLLDHVKASGHKKIWKSELMRWPEGHTRGMHGSGLLIANPPWQCPETLTDAYTSVARVWGGSARHHGTWLCPE
ncbi:23S rRNA (adenine(2030)-N(6))-methyltransferase RlmJ [Larsenimonas suaedae]|uniref:Ribosomal RNA large subunit methyltransferase J n=1 Tax=Larsenimonas suaedae TaxID=1851019 RepID=A0ABU1GR48_9GAMM|nr:23S rRNA (adenine(2030)-N(6))-methyltransferase RlmJ [Larsenimonas suaedae]MDR5894499.1 23S rRNA (adenine(2030)-N(6))-methyltransferase RlmJ [Larsenimonas suaedae]